MAWLDAFRWQGSNKVYSLPWLKNRLQYCSDPKRIAVYARTRFTRSRFVMAMLTQFHLSRNSIVVSGDSHALWLKQVFLDHLPKTEALPQIAREVMERVFPHACLGQGVRSVQISDVLIRELYLTMLDKVLNVTALKPLEDYIAHTKFPHGSRPMLLEGLMYSLRLHLPVVRPIRFLLDRLFFKDVLYMKRVSRTLEQMVYDFSLPRSGSWFSTLAELRGSGKITRAQFRGEITSMLVSSFSLASALGSALLCLAARPRYQKKIHDDPAFAKYFVMEVLRLYPPFRQFGYEQAAANGSHLSGNEFMIAVFALHRNSDIWESPQKFCPERFLEPGATGGFKYLPFGMGKRGCPGRMFSMSLIVEAVKFVCSNKSQFILAKRDSLPKGGSGRLVSFVLDDTLSYRAR